MLENVQLVRSDDESEATEADIAEDDAYEDDYELESNGNHEKCNDQLSREDQPLMSQASPQVSARTRATNDLRRTVDASEGTSAT